MWFHHSKITFMNRDLDFEVEIPKGPFLLSGCFRGIVLEWSFAPLSTCHSQLVLEWGFAPFSTSLNLYSMGLRRTGSNHTG
jgi:hypothetical protein